jgi:DUF1365 family protein
MHRRLRPVAHRFSYPVFYLRIPLSQWNALPRAFLSIDRWNLFSILRRDFGPRDGSDLQAWMRALLERHGLAAADGEIVLQAFPRVLGYVFNPIVIWYAHDREGQLRAVLCEVSNTFGERHHYLLAHDDARPIVRGDAMFAAKALHVSPFCEVTGHYRFDFGASERFPRVRIDYHDAQGLLLVTALHGESQPLTARRLLRAFFAYPFMTAAVIARIHWQALRLWLRGVPWFAKPETPLKELSR